MPKWKAMYGLIEYAVLFHFKRDEPENDEADDMPEVQETVQVIPGSKLLWRISSRPSNSSQVSSSEHWKWIYILCT